MNIEVIKNRKGAQKAADIPSEVLLLLNTGTIETVNLTEWLAIDHSQLAKSVFPTLGIDKNIIEEIVCQINQQKKPSTMNTIRLIGALLYKKYANTNLYEPLFEQLSNHLSDSVRCYACYLVALHTDIPLEDKLHKLKPLVADSHFGVREIIWMALRPEMSNYLDFSIAFLSHWAESEDENIRRFSTEASADPYYFSIVSKETEKAIGTLSLMRIEPKYRVIEVGAVTYSDTLKHTRIATEAQYLLAKYVFETLQYRRYEWKCDSLNMPSRRAAERLGFVYEGTFRQAVVYKGRSRDTAWFSMIDKEWSHNKRSFERWLSKDNFDSQGKQKQSLQTIRQLAN